MPGDPWWFGPWGWRVSHVVEFDAPIPCKGKQGLWTVPVDIEQRLLAEHPALRENRTLHSAAKDA